MLRLGGINERFFMPWVDMMDAMKEHDMSLFSDRTRAPECKCVVLGVRWQNEK